MAAENQSTMGSDNENAERPVREQLKKASISKASGGVATPSDEITQEKASMPESSEDVEDAETRGRSPNQQSVVDAEGEKPPEKAVPANTRKRSRDSTAEEEELNNGQRKSLDRPRDTENVEAEPSETSSGNVKTPAAVRPGTPEPNGEKQGEAVAEQITSPKTKKSRLQASSGQSEEVLPLEAKVAKTPPTEEGDTRPQSTENDVTKEVAEKEESNVSAKSDTKIPATSGFANTATTSPFASLASPKSPSAEPQTSANAFAASGFSALTGSASGFGAVGKSFGGFGIGGGFATGRKSPVAGGDTDTIFGKQTTSPSTVTPTPASDNATNGSAQSQPSIFKAPSVEKNGSLFGGGSSGFAKVGEAGSFGSGLNGKGFGGFPGNGGLTTFASGKPSPALAGTSKPAKAFGAPVDDEDEAGGEDEADDADETGIKSPLSQESDKQDERFYQQDLETGEEDEFTEYSCRAKLYNFASTKEWKERGLGVVRLNVTKAGPGEGDSVKPRARLLMRADGSHRVILNTPIKKEIKFGAPVGGPPQGGFVYFMGTVDGMSTLTLLQLKIRSQCAMELYEKVVELQEAL